MTPWTSDELARIGSTDEVQISFLRPDGTLSRPRIIWVVRHGDGLYVRSVNGPTAAWYRGTQVSHEGRIHADGIDKDVTFTEADDVTDDDLDDAYRTKYRRYAAEPVRAITSPEAIAATIKLVPR